MLESGPPGAKRVPHGRPLKQTNKQTNKQSIGTKQVPSDRSPGSLGGLVSYPLGRPTERILRILALLGASIRSIR